MADNENRAETIPGEDINPEQHVTETPEQIQKRSGFLDWAFRSRTTGRITVGQLPNGPLTVWLVASAALWLGHPHGRVRVVFVVIATAALALWAGGEALRGVNPFRRLLGVTVLAWLVLSLVRG
jgi:hypothetical protein